MFAARSVRERADWISAIWDAILPHEKSNGQHSAVIPTDNTRTLPVQSPIPTPLPRMSSLLDPSLSGRSLPPLPTNALLDPSKDTKPSNLHLDLSELKGPFSPSIYPPTSGVVSAPETTVSYFSLADKPGNLHPLLRVDTSTTSVRKAGGSNSSVVISPSLYPPTYRPGSVSPIASTARSTLSSSSRSSSPSVANLSQLSVVRQRLAQIERNHSQLSSQSGFTGITARVSTPTPVSPAGSRWSKSEAVFHNTGNSTSRPHSSSSVNDSSKSLLDSHDAKAKATTERTLSKPTVSKDVKEEALAPVPNPGPSKDDIRKLSKGLDEIKNVLGGESGCPTIHQVVVSLDHRTQGQKEAFKAIQETLGSLSERITDAIHTASAEAAGSAKLDSDLLSSKDEVTLQALKELDEKVSKAFSTLSGKIKDVREAQEKGKTTELHALAPQAVTSARDSNPVDLQPVLTKIDEIRALYEASPATLKDGKQDAKNDPKLPEHLIKILSLVQEDSNKQTLLAQQQADSVRYLNELNSWLEAFVQNGTSQIQGISANVDRLCNELGFNSDLVPGSNQSNLVNDIRQLVVGMKARDQNFAALQAAVHSLLEVLTNSQTQKEADSQAIAGLMDRQRHDQEVLFRAFTTGDASCHNNLHWPGLILL
ncbi:hypothetical protein CPB84DRAFT_1772964 [Gymnopilus junonius]|uniref:PH domain-containing protein n=1 Tax=Gymnopilus junonius TaxID=109634 RepID=A0A9P5NUL3_GYMJU|nr:hypothetical protein CPB84DRAFT_1772964 [Gymnopilus junonius]